MPRTSKRPRFYEYPINSDAFSLDSFIHKKVQERLADQRSGMLDDRNVHSYRHGTKWSLDASLGGATEMQSFSAETIIHTVDIIDHDTSIIESHIGHLSNAMYSSLMIALYKTVGEAAENVGNTVDASQDKGDISKGFLSMLRKIEFGVDRYGHPTRPSVHLHPSQTEKFLSSLRAQTSDFHLEVEMISMSKEREATAREAERISRFRWKPDELRALIAIGCDNYDHIDNLHSAQKDATSVFNALVGREEHQYNSDHSKLLLSPTTSELREQLSDALYNIPQIAVFTLFFAGHGAVVDETLYLALSDTRSDRIPATAISFPEILRSTAGARPKQANFLIDACNAGGLGFDIGSILKRTIVGNSDTMGISFIAAAAANQSALEFEAGGVFTVELTKIIKGDTFVQQSSPFLNLSEIAQHIQGTTVVTEQDISYWTLNLQGPNLFARNVHFSGQAYAAGNIAAQLQKHKIETARLGAEFKSALAKIKSGIRERSFSKISGDVFSEIPAPQRLSLIYGLAEGLKVDLQDVTDPFLENRVYSVLLGQVLSTTSSPDRRIVISHIMGWFFDASRRTLTLLDETMKVDRNALLIGTLSELYDLPIRISDILGQCALFILGQDKPSDDDLALVIRVVRRILERYGNSILALTDDQATGFLLFLEACRQRSWTEFGEETIGRLYYDLHANFGRVGAYSLDAEGRFKLLGERYEDSPVVTRNLYNSPSDLTTVILTFSALYLLDEAIDFTLIEIDHTTVNYFIPETLDGVGLIQDLSGANITLTLGRDFWRCIDLRRILYADVFPAFHCLVAGAVTEDRFCAMASALALRDRLPWQCIALTDLTS